MSYTSDSPNQIGHQLEVNQGTGDVPPNPNKISTPMNDHLNELLKNPNAGNWTPQRPAFEIDPKFGVTGNGHIPANEKPRYLSCKVKVDLIVQWQRDVSESKFSGKVVKQGSSIYKVGEVRSDWNTYAFEPCDYTPPVTVEQLKTQLEAVTAERDKYKAEVDTLNHKLDYSESESNVYVVRLFKQGERIAELEQENAKLKARQDQVGEMLAEVLNLLAKNE